VKVGEERVSQRESRVERCDRKGDGERRKKKKSERRLRKKKKKKINNALAPLAPLSLLSLSLSLSLQNLLYLLLA